MNLAAELASILGPDSSAPSLRFRQGVIVSVEMDDTCTVTIAGDTDTPISGVAYASTVCPVPGATCWIAMDGTDLFIIATLAPAGPAYAQARKNAAQSVPNATWTDVTWGTVTDTAAYGMTIGSAGFTVIVPGIYQVSTALSFPSQSTGQRHAQLTVNGAVIMNGTGGNTTTGGDIARLRADGIVRCAAGDVIGATVYQSSGAALNMNTGTGLNMMRAVWLGPYA